MLPDQIGVDIPILRVVFPERVFFDTDSAELKPAAVEIAAIIAASLRNEPPDVVMFVSGHADARASRSYNTALSIDRANALAEAVLDMDVNVASVWRVGFGEDLPLVAGDSDYAYGQNRRIEFLFAARPEALAQWLAGPQQDQICQGRTRRETEACRRTRVVAPGYDVLRVQPAPARRAQLRPSARPRTATAPGAARPAVTSPTSTPGAVSAPSRDIGIRLDLSRARRIRLDLTHRSARPLYTDRDDSPPEREE